MNVYIVTKTKKFKTILDETNNYLSKYTTFRENSEKEYFRRLSQKIETLLDLINLGLLPYELYRQVITTFNKIIPLYEANKNNKALNDLYVNFKYLTECVMLIIETEYLYK
jgi:hypothetical protein